MSLSRILVLLCAATAGHAASAPEIPPRWFSAGFEQVLGTSLELKFEANSAEDAAFAERAALAEIDRLNALLSGYDATSEFSRWMATRHEPVRVSAELFDVLALFDRWRERTGGALDAAAETAGGLWQRAAQRGQEPSDEELRAAVATMRQVHWRLDPRNHTATHLTDAPLRLNSFAKSCIIDLACNAALHTGRVRSAVVNIGGDLVVRGRAADPVAVADPDAAAENDEPIAHVTLRDRAIATSGDYRRGWRIGGKWFSHLLDPRTGHPTDAVRSATVVSRSATDAGALATALCVMNPDDGIALAASFPEIDYLMVLADGTHVMSPGWSSLAGAEPARPVNVHGALAVTAVSNPSALADRPSTELVVNLEIASVGGGRAKRPFVAVWIEDKDHFPVRTLGLWFKGARWLPDLRAWSRADQLRSMAEGSRNPQSIASATRGPGQYSLRWDGKDDAGKSLPSGPYTVMIEAAREHGTHQLASAEIDTAGGLQRKELPGNQELSSISLELRRPTDPR